MENRMKDWMYQQSIRNNKMIEISDLKRDIDNIKSRLNSIRTSPEDGGKIQAWYDGIDIPDNLLGEDGDYYLQIDNGDIWKKQFSYWERIGSIKGISGKNGINGIDGKNGLNGMNGSDGVQGPPGAPGTDGSNGAVWHDGNGEPPSILGNFGDYFLNVESGDIYNKIYSNWERVGNLRGPQGIQGETGPEPSISHLEQTIEDKVILIDGKIEIINDKTVQINNLIDNFTVFSQEAHLAEESRVLQEKLRKEYIDSLASGLSVLQGDVDEILTSI